MSRRGSSSSSSCRRKCGIFMGAGGRVRGRGRARGDVRWSNRGRVEGVQHRGIFHVLKELPVCKRMGMKCVCKWARALSFFGVNVLWML